MTFRQGHKVPRNIYDGDRPVLVALQGDEEAAALAARVVRVINQDSGTEPRRPHATASASSAGTSPPAEGPKAGAVPTDAERRSLPGVTSDPHSPLVEPSGTSAVPRLRPYTSREEVIALAVFVAEDSPEDGPADVPASVEHWSTLGIENRERYRAKARRIMDAERALVPLQMMIAAEVAP